MRIYVVESEGGVICLDDGKMLLAPKEAPAPAAPAGQGAAVRPAKEADLFAEPLTLSGEKWEYTREQER